MAYNITTKASEVIYDDLDEEGLKLDYFVLMTDNEIDKLV